MLACNDNSKGKMTMPANNADSLHTGNDSANMDTTVNRTTIPTDSGYREGGSYHDQ